MRLGPSAFSNNSTRIFFYFENGELNLLAHYFLFSIIISCFDKAEKLRGRG